jgi:hypothetical protein
MKRPVVIPDQRHQRSPHPVAAPGQSRPIRRSQASLVDQLLDLAERFRLPPLTTKSGLQSPGIAAGPPRATSSSSCSSRRLLAAKSSRAAGRGSTAASFQIERPR